jgi:ABC-type sugar transport system ATPase subunit
VLGIRPEDIHEQEAAGAIPVDMKIVAIEALGPETVVVGEIPGVGEISARIGRAFSAPIGSVQRLSLDARQFHIFDAQTTLALRRKYV